MLKQIAIFTSLIAIGIILSSSMTFAASHTFSIYGHTQYDNGSSIPDTTIRLIEPINNTRPITEWSFSYMMPAINSTVTDNNGNFQFINVTTNYSTLCLDIQYPAAQPTNPQLVYVGRDKVLVNTSGIQYINITRWSTQNPDLPLSPFSRPLLPPSSSMVGTSLTTIIFGLVGLFIIQQNKK
jgi:hypothetical protein